MPNASSTQKHHAPIAVSATGAAGATGHPPAHRLPPLRITTCGSVDDGKSTLIGRLLFDTGSIPVDQIEAIERASRARGQTQPDLSLLTDGLRAEREQGITIDVAYRYFGTPRRRFIVADAPGHTQYTRNMATAASVADLAIVLIDARHGVTSQTRRHALIASMMRVPRLVVAVNKIDLVSDARETFERLRQEFLSLIPPSSAADVQALPISALLGDNVAVRSKSMPWYEGPTLLEILEQYRPLAPTSLPLRLQVQSVIRPGNGAGASARAYGGVVLAGHIAPGAEVIVLPSGLRTRVASVGLHDESLLQAAAPRAVTITLADEIDVARGDVIASVDDQPHVASRVEADVVWFDRQALRPGARLMAKQGTRVARAIVERIEHRIDLATFAPGPTLGSDTNDGRETLAENEIGRVRLKTSSPLVFDPYGRSRETGAFILVDEATTNTVGGGMLVAATES